MTTAWANWNGLEMPLDEVMVPALDRAFLFGDAVYEVIRVYHGRPWKLNEHLDRLVSSMEGIRLTGVDIGTIRTRVESTLQSSGASEAVIYIQVTRGAARRTHHFPTVSKPNVLVSVEEFVDPYAQCRDKGVKAITCADIRWARSELKATSLLANCLAAQAAVEAGCAEAILIDAKGCITEGSHTSVFGVRDGKIVVSPAAPNILPGITKRQVLSLAKQSQIDLIEGKLSRDDLWSCQEVFITATLAEILSVVEIDGCPVAGGVSGSVTRRLQQTFKQSVESWLQATVN